MNALTIHDRYFGGVVTRRSASDWVPDLVAAAGPRATDAYIGFFTAKSGTRTSGWLTLRACYLLIVAQLSLSSGIERLNGIRQCAPPRCHPIGL
jgi:hypothetical protein